MMSLIEAAFAMDRALAQRGLDRTHIEQVDIVSDPGEPGACAYVYAHSTELILNFNLSRPFDPDRVKEAFLPAWHSVN
jgi:hypothetical protein